MKAIEQLFFVLLFIVLYKVVLTYKLELRIVTFLEWYYFKFTVWSKNALQPGVMGGVCISSL